MTTTVALLLVLVAMTLLVVFVWRDRERTEREAHRLRAEAERARHVESIAADAANLLAAVSQSLMLARDDSDEELAKDSKRWVDVAYESTRSLIALFEAARVEVIGAPVIPPNEAPAEGLMRLAVAIARAEGSGILLESEPSDLTIGGSAPGIVQSVVEALKDVHARVRKPGFVTVRIGAERIAITAPIETAPDIEDLATKLRPAGWIVEPRQHDHDLGFVLRPSDRGDDEPNLEDHAAGALRQHRGSA